MITVLVWVFRFYVAGLPGLVDTGFGTPVWMFLGCGFEYGFVWAFGLLAMCVLISVGGFWVLRSRGRGFVGECDFGGVSWWVG